MTDSPAQPEGGWAQAPRPPLTAVLTEDDLPRLVSEAVRSTELRPFALRVGVSVIVGGLLAMSYGPAVGVLGAVALAALAAALVALRRRALADSLVAGSARSTGYDPQGRFVVAGSDTTVLERGSVRSVRRSGGVAVLQPRQRRGRPVVLLDQLVTAADEAVLTTAPHPGTGAGGVDG